MSVPIDLRFSHVDPPAPEPKRSIYFDLVNLPDPVYLGLTVRIFNYDDVALYMRVDAYKSGWTFTTNNLGSLGSGANQYYNLDNFGNRAKPATELEETITVRLRAYTDSGYTNLKWTFERVIDIVFIKSDDGSWTTDFLNNFDDGTVQGWAVINEENNDAGYPTLTVVTDYVLSTPYSVRMRQYISKYQSPYNWCLRARLYKSFVTPDRPNIFAIIDLRHSSSYQLNARPWVKNFRAQRDDTLLVWIGRPYNTDADNTFPLNKWMRLVVPLPRNTTIDMRILVEAYANVYGSGSWARVDTWMDDFRIISKA